MRRSLISWSESEVPRAVLEGRLVRLRARMLECGLDGLLLGETHVGDRGAAAELGDELVDRPERATPRRADQTVRQAAEQRHAIEARVIGERNYTDIAGELHCSEAVVRKRVSRGLRALRTRLAGER